MFDEDDYNGDDRYDDDEPMDMTDVEADADTLRSCGWGTDEDYGYDDRYWEDQTPCTLTFLDSML